MFSLQLKELRTRQALTQKELAKILNVSTGTVGNWEAGTREPDFAMTVKIADYFNVSLDELFGREFPQKELRCVTVTPAEAALLDDFRRTDEEGQTALLAILNRLGKQ